VVPAGTLIWLIELYQLALSAFEGGEGIRNGPFLDYRFQAAQKSDHGLTSTWNVGNVGLNRPM